MSRGAVRRRMCVIALAVLLLAALGLLAVDQRVDRPVSSAISMKRAAWRLSRMLAAPGAEVRQQCLAALMFRNTATGDSVYAHLSPADKARARGVVLWALADPSPNRRQFARAIIRDSITTDMDKDADNIGRCLATASDAGARHEIASALASTGNTEAMRRHLSKALIAEPVRGNRLWYATFLWWHDLGPVEARLLTRRAGGKLPATESEALAELKKELATGSQEAADALCFSGHLDLLSDKQKADLAGRLGPGGHARVFPRAPGAERD